MYCLLLLMANKKGFLTNLDSLLKYMFESYPFNHTKLIFFQCKECIEFYTHFNILLLNMFPGFKNVVTRIQPPALRLRSRSVIYQIAIIVQRKFLSVMITVCWSITKNSCSHRFVFGRNEKYSFNSYSCLQVLGGIHVVISVVVLDYLIPSGS